MPRHSQGHYGVGRGGFGGSGGRGGSGFGFNNFGIGGPFLGGFTGSLLGSVLFPQNQYGGYPPYMYQPYPYQYPYGYPYNYPYGYPSYYNPY